jgi:hypothetical protein
MCEALGSILSNTKKRKKEERFILAHGFRGLNARSLDLVALGLHDAKHPSQGEESVAEKTAHLMVARK